MPENISPVELEERLSLMADGVYRQLIAMAKEEEEKSNTEATELRSIASKARKKIINGINEFPASDHFDELHDLYIQAKYIQRSIIRRSSPESLNREYLLEWVSHSS